MKKNKTLLFFVIFVLLVGMFGCNNSINENKYYTYDELNEMNSQELYNLFVSNGLEVNDEIKVTFDNSEVRIAEFFKEDFEIMITGTTARDHTMYQDIATSTKEVYDKLIQKNNK